MNKLGIGVIITGIALATVMLGTSFIPTTAYANDFSKITMQVEQESESKALFTSGTIGFTQTVFVEYEFEEGAGTASTSLTTNNIFGTFETKCSFDVIDARHTIAFGFPAIESNVQGTCVQIFNGVSGGAFPVLGQIIGAATPFGFALIGTPSQTGIGNAAGLINIIP